MSSAHRIGSRSQIGISTKYEVEEVQSSDGAVTKNQIDQLVSAMSTFDRPSAGSVVPTEMEDQLRPVIASAWDVA